MKRSLAVATLIYSISFGHLNAETVDDIKSKAEVLCVKMGATRVGDDLIRMNMLTDFGFTDAKLIMALNNVIKVVYDQDDDPQSKCVNIILRQFEKQQGVSTE